MDRYLSDDDIVVRPSVSIEERRGFSEVEMAGVLARMEEEQKTVMYNVGVGGSLAAQPLVHQGRIYIGACDCGKNNQDFLLHGFKLTVGL